MQTRNMTPSDLRQQLGLKNTATTCYPWINGTGAPQTKHHSKLARVLGLSKEQMTPRDFATKPTTAVTVTQAISAPRIRTNDVLSFTVSADGHVRIKLDAELPLEQGSSLLRMLLDAGIVYSPRPPSDA
jgi:hypothetical protein